MTRITQILARYLAIALIGLAVKCGCELSEADAAKIAEPAALAIMAAGLLIYDHLSHRWQQAKQSQTPPPPSNN